MKLYHGTPYSIHNSEKPYLDPNLAVGRDEGDPEVPHVFATPDLIAAVHFAFKTKSARSRLETDSGTALVYRGDVPSMHDKGFVYEVAPKGFQETLQRGQPSGKWALLAEHMELVTDPAGNKVPGLPVGKPVVQLVFGDIIRDGARIYQLHPEVDVAIYLKRARDAIFTRTTSEFIDEAIADLHWLEDVTPPVPVYE